MDETDAGPGRLAAALEQARAARRTIPIEALDLPRDLAAAYRTQAARWTARPVCGWKVALDREGRSLFAPLDPLWQSTDAGISWQPGLRLEVELAFVLGRDLPARPERAYTIAELEDAVTTLHIGVEIITGRLAEGDAAPFPFFLADALGNGGYLLGPYFTGDRLNPGRVGVAVGGRTLFDGEARHPQGDPILPLLARTNRPAAGWGDLEAGQIVTTGSLCGVLTPSASGEITVTLGANELVFRLGDPTTFDRKTTI